MLEEEFLEPLGLTKYRLTKDIGVPAQRIGEIVSGKRAVTADTDLRLCRRFGRNQAPEVTQKQPHCLDLGHVVRPRLLR